MKTFSPNADEAKAERDWWVVDATGETLGRLASRIAAVLRGKHKPTFTPNLDTGDFVIVTNCEKVAVTGDKPLRRVGGVGGGRGSENGRPMARPPAPYLVLGHSVLRACSMPHLTSTRPLILS